MMLFVAVVCRRVLCLSVQVQHEKAGNDSSLLFGKYMFQ